MVIPKSSLAIIGGACRLPGNVVDFESFWQLLAEGREAVQEIPEDRWNQRAYYSREPGVSGRTNAKWGGFLAEIREFEPECFGISPREAAFLDPQQRLLLETAWEALESAGLPLEQLAGTRTGVCVGMSAVDYGVLQRSTGNLRYLSAFTAQGSSLGIAANRISYCLDLRGPSFVVDTACSSSLVALHAAATSLWNFETDLMLVGGANLLLTPDAFVSFSDASMLSPDGHCHAFDAAANGFVRAEGAGVIVLKRLEDALRDGDSIGALVLSTGVNQDGRTGGMSVPNAIAQESLLREVYHRAGVLPNAVQYVEAHGTGTAIGDPIEAEALGRFFGANRDHRQPLMIGSVKTNIGHLEAASGIASLIKAVLILQKRQIPPSLHLRTPNPTIAFDQLKLRVVTAQESWPDEKPGLIGVNSFGFGGTNAHALLGEYRRDERDFAGARAAAGRSTDRSPHPLRQITKPREFPFVLSARSDEALKSIVAAWLDDSTPVNIADAAWSDVAFTAALRRSNLSSRLGCVAGSFAEVREQLAAFLRDEPAPTLQVATVARQAPQIAFVFCGQGAQWHGMGCELCATEPLFRETLDEIDEILRDEAGWSLIEELHRDEKNSRMEATSISQPALFALQVGLARLWRSWGIEPAAVLGHSVGELAAAQVVGLLSLKAAVQIVTHRGRCLEEYASPGRMVAAAVSEVESAAIVSELADGVCVAAINSPQMVTFAGTDSGMERLSRLLQSRGFWHQSLAVGHAFHSPLVEQARGPFLEAIGDVASQEAMLEMVSTVTAEPLHARSVTASYWWDNIRRPVQFSTAINALMQRGIDSFVEIGPHPVLSTSIRQCRGSGDSSPLVVSSLRRGANDRRNLLSSLTALWCRGAKARWQTFWPEGGSIVPLPRHPWMRQIYWREAPETRQSRLEPNYHPLLGSRLTGADFAWQAVFDPKHLNWLPDHRVGTTVVVPVAALVEMTVAAATRVLETSACTIDNFRMVQALVLVQGATPTVVTTVDRTARMVTIRSRLGEEGLWSLHVEATFRSLSSQAETTSLDAESWIGTSHGRDESAVVYDKFRAAGFDYGSAFSGVAEAHYRHRDDAPFRDVLGRVIAPECIADLDHGYHAHPGILDACFQTIIETIPAETNFAGALYLPQRIDRVHYLRPPGANPWSEVRLLSFSPGHITADIRVYREDGLPALDIRGFRGASVARRPQDRAQDLATSVFKTDWQLSPLPRAGNAIHPFVLRALLEDLVRAADRSASLSWGDVRPGDSAEYLRLAGLVARTYYMRALAQLGDARDAEVRISLETLIASGRVAAQYRRYVGRFLDQLVTEGAARQLGPGEWLIHRDSAAEDSSEAWRIVLRRFPECYALTRLVELCGSQLTAIWSGSVNPLELLFSNEGLQLLQRIYQDEPWSLYANQFIRELLVQFVTSLPEDRPLRVLEVGAGTGATTQLLLAVLPPNRTEYWFTDVSPFFLTRAQEQFGKFERVRFTRLDVEQNFAEQDIPEKYFDVVIAANVLHATSDIRAAVKRCGQALVDGGCLVLREECQLNHAVELVFGLTEDWWKYQLDPLRPHGTFLKVDRWHELLREEGYEVFSPETCGLTRDYGMVVVARHMTEMRELRPAERPESARASHHSLLVFADRQGVGSGLIAKMQEQDVSCVEVTAGTCFNQLDDGNYCINVDDPEDMQRLFAAWREKSHGEYSIVNLWSLDTAEPEGSHTKVVEAAESLTCHTLMHALQQFAATPTEAPRRIFVVTRGARCLAGEGSAASCQQAQIVGLTRVAINEFPSVGLRLIDLDPRESDSLDALWAEINTEEDVWEDEVVWRNGCRFVPRLIPAELETAAAGPMSAGNPVNFEVRPLIPGVLSSLEMQEIPPRMPGPGEIQVAIRYVAMNFRDILRALGRQPAESSFELELGDECAGIVTAVGENVPQFRVGDRVVACAIGAFRSTITCAASTFLPVPPQMTMQDAVSMPVAFVTADYALRCVAHLERGESVLIHSAAGGVGLAAVQVAQHLGAEIFATAGSPAKRDLLRHLGVRRIFDSRSLDFSDAVLDATEGRGVDVVLNSLAGHAMFASLSCVAPYGRFLELGKRDFHENTKVGLWPFRRNLSYFAVDLVPLVTHEIDRLRQLLGDIFQLTDDGRYYPLPQRFFPVERVADAFRLMSHGTHIGKIVVDMAQHRNRVRRTPRTPMIREDATYLITGAFGGVGLLTAEWLADRGARHLALLSRGGAQTPAAHDVLTRLRARGVNVFEVGCDVADADQLRHALEAIRCEMPRLAGVFHLAMILDDGLLTNLNCERFRRVTRPKVLGGWNLHWQTLETGLDYFVVFSSASGWFGNFGQASYAAANSALEGLIEWRRSCGLPGTAIAWGMLTETGYVADRPELMQSLQQLGLLGLSRQDVRYLLDLILGTNQGLVVTLPIDRQRFAQRFMKLKKSRGILTNLAEVATNTDVADGSNTAREKILSASADSRLALIHEYLRGVAGRVLGIAPAKLQLDRPLFDLGLDSLMALELSNLIETQLGVPVPMSEITRSVSIDKMGVALLVALQSESAHSTGPQSRPPLAACLVKLVEASNAPSLFCFHPAGGELGIYRDLAASLAGRYAVYGIQSPTVAGLADEFPSLREMCNSYAELILQAQPQGSYQLFGFSLGGIIAAGTARALEDRGRHVSLLGVAECDLSWSQSHEHQSVTISNMAVQLYELLGQEFASLRDHPQIALEHEFRALAESLLSSAPGRVGSAILMWAESGGYLPDDIPRDVAIAHFSRIETHLRLLLTSEGGGQVAAPLYLWTATDGLVHAERHWSDVTTEPAGSWIIEGGHFDVLAARNAQAVADQLEALMMRHDGTVSG